MADFGDIDRILEHCDSDDDDDNEDEGNTKPFQPEYNLTHVKKQQSSTKKRVKNNGNYEYKRVS